MNRIAKSCVRHWSITYSSFSHPLLCPPGLLVLVSCWLSCLLGETQLVICGLRTNYKHFQKQDFTNNSDVITVDCLIHRNRQRKFLGLEKFINGNTRVIFARNASAEAYRNIACARSCALVHVILSKSSIVQSSQRIAEAGRPTGERMKSARTIVYSEMQQI